MSLMRPVIAEFLGSFLFFLFGTGAVASAVMTGAQVGLWQVAVVWGLGLTFAIYLTAAVSGAHLNPAVSLAFAIFRPREFPWRNLAPYWVAQVLGGVLAGLVVLGVFGPFIARFEAGRSIVRGDPGSEASAMAFGEYFPNPAVFGTDAAAQGLISPLGAAAVEALGTGILVMMIFALVDRRNVSLTGKYLAPALIGFTVAALFSVLAPLTQAGFNPARDFGPRVVAFFAGWGDAAIPGPRNGFWAYIVGPLVGGPIGAAVYEYLLRPALKAEPPAGGEVAGDAAKPAQQVPPARPAGRPPIRRRPQ